MKRGEEAFRTPLLLSNASNLSFSFLAISSRSARVEAGGGGVLAGSCCGVLPESDGGGNSPASVDGGVSAAA